GGAEWPPAASGGASRLCGPPNLRLMTDTRPPTRGKLRRIELIPRTIGGRFGQPRENKAEDPPHATYPIPRSGRASAEAQGFHGESGRTGERLPHAALGGKRDRALAPARQRAAAQVEAGPEAARVGDRARRASLPRFL